MDTKEPVRSRGAQPGNQNASKENREYRAALMRTVKQYEGRGISRGDALNKVTEKLLELALDGELPAIKELGKNERNTNTLQPSTITTRSPQQPSTF